MRLTRFLDRKEIADRRKYNRLHEKQTVIAFRDKKWDREINGYHDTKLNIHEPMNNSLALYKAGRMSRDRWGACVGGGVIMAHG